MHLLVLLRVNFLHYQTTAVGIPTGNYCHHLQCTASPNSYTRPTVPTVIICSMHYFLSARWREDAIASMSWFAAREASNAVERPRLRTSGSSSCERGICKCCRKAAASNWRVAPLRLARAELARRIGWRRGGSGRHRCGALSRRQLRLTLLMESHEIAPIFDGAAWAGTLVWEAALSMTGFLETSPTMDRTLQGQRCWSWARRG